MPVSPASITPLPTAGGLAKSLTWSHHFSAFHGSHCPENSLHTPAWLTPLPAAPVLVLKIAFQPGVVPKEIWAFSNRLRSSSSSSSKSHVTQPPGLPRPSKCPSYPACRLLQLHSVACRECLINVRHEAETHTLPVPGCNLSGFVNSCEWTVPFSFLRAWAQTLSSGVRILNSLHLPHPAQNSSLGPSHPERLQLHGPGQAWSGLPTPARHQPRCLEPLATLRAGGGEGQLELQGTGSSQKSGAEQVWGLGSRGKDFASVIVQFTESEYMCVRTCVHTHTLGALVPLPLSLL